MDLPKTAPDLAALRRELLEQDFTPDEAWQLVLAIAPAAVRTHGLQIDEDDEQPPSPEELEEARSAWRR